MSLTGKDWWDHWNGGVDYPVLETQDNEENSRDQGRTGTKGFLYYRSQRLDVGVLDGVEDDSSAGVV